MIALFKYVKGEVIKSNYYLEGWSVCDSHIIFMWPVAYLSSLIARKLSRNWYQAYIAINILVTTLRPQKEVPRTVEMMVSRLLTFCLTSSTF